VNPSSVTASNGGSEHILSRALCAGEKLSAHLLLLLLITYTTEPTFIAFDSLDPPIALLASICLSVFLLACIALHFCLARACRQVRLSPLLCSAL
jgi:hypothetical protein